MAAINLNKEQFQQMAEGGKPILVDRKDADEITHEEVRALTDHLVSEIRKLSGQEYVDEYAQKVKAELKARQEAEAATAGEGR